MVGVIYTFVAECCVSIMFCYKIHLTSTIIVLGQVADANQKPNTSFLPYDFIRFDGFCVVTECLDYCIDRYKYN